MSCGKWTKCYSSEGIVFIKSDWSQLLPNMFLISCQYSFLSWGNNILETLESHKSVDRGWQDVHLYVSLFLLHHKLWMKIPRGDTQNAATKIIGCKQKFRLMSGILWECVPRDITKTGFRVSTFYNFGINCQKTFSMKKVRFYH